MLMTGSTFNRMSVIAALAMMEAPFGRVVIDAGDDLLGSPPSARPPQREQKRKPTEHKHGREIARRLRQEARIAAKALGK